MNQKKNIVDAWLELLEKDAQVCWARKQVLKGKSNLLCDTLGKILKTKSKDAPTFGATNLYHHCLPPHLSD